VDWIHLVQDRIQWWVNIIMTLWVLITGERFIG